jgi:hypothetical protein
MKRKIICSIAISLLVLLLTTIAASAITPRMPGVHPGDQFVYAAILSWNSNDPNATIPWNFQSMNGTLWVMVTITNVQVTNVTGQTVQHFKNGTEQHAIGYVDVNTGTGENLTMWVIAANLNANDSIYTTGYYSSWIINDTIPILYPAGVRQTNHFNITMTYSVPNVTIYQSENFYWDRLTGVMTGATFDFSNQTDPYLTTMHFGIQITASSLWVIPEYPSFLSLPVLLLATLMTANFIRKRKRRIGVVEI